MKITDEVLEKFKAGTWAPSSTQLHHMAAELIAMRAKHKSVPAGMLEQLRGACSLGLAGLIAHGAPEGATNVKALTEAIELIDLAMGNRCRVRWVEGILTSPKWGPRPTGRCMLDQGHEGPHRIPGHQFPLPEDSREASAAVAGLIDGLVSKSSDPEPTNNED